MSATSLRLLRAAAEAAGGTDLLAARLGISEAMLRKYMAGTFPLPDPVLLRTVDFILESRDAGFPLSSGPPFLQPGRELSGED